MTRGIQKKIIVLIVIIFSLFLPIISHAINLSPYLIYKNAGDQIVVINEYGNYYIIEYDYDCYSSDFDEGDIIYIDSYSSPSYGDTIIIDNYSDTVCEVTDAEEVNLKEFYLIKDLNSDDKIIVEDKDGDKYLIEYGIGCGLSMWRYEDEWIHIDIGGLFLDGIGDRIYLFDSGRDCRVWDAEEIDSSNSGSYPVDYNAICVLNHGANSYAIGSDCYCKTGYKWNDSQTICVVDTPTCSDLVNGYMAGDNKCYCNIGYEWSSTLNKCTKIIPDCSVYGSAFWESTSDTCACMEGYIMQNNHCITHTENCQAEYGSNVYGVRGNENNSSCYCNSGYKWNDTRTKCVEINTPPTDSEGVVLGTQIDMELANRLKGKLLLQVEQAGRIWYVDFNGKRHEVTFANALLLFKNLALGISNNDLNRIPMYNKGGTSAMGNRLKGKLLLQVEDRGRIWYVDFNGRRWEVTWDNLMGLFESLSLGITNSDLGKIAKDNL